MKGAVRAVFCGLLFLLRLSDLVAQDIARQDDARFITIYLHGWSNAISKKPVKDGLYGPGEFEGAKERAQHYGEYNIMHYRFSNMADYDSDTFIREIGDFNGGSLLIEEEYRQPFVSLARCEWVYRHSPSLWALAGGDYYNPDGSEPWWILNKNEIMTKLLKSGPRFTDFFMVEPQGNVDYLAGKIWNALKDIDGGISLGQAETIARELCQLATGDYVDTALSDSVGGNKCPNAIRFVTHSMGGMMALKYVGEGAELYTQPGDLARQHGFYQRNLDYTQEKFADDRAQMSWYAGTIPAGKRGDETLYKIFKAEREISVEKILLQDSPVAGTPLASEITGLLSTVSKMTESNKEWFAVTGPILGATAVNIVIATLEMMLGSALMAAPGLQDVGRILIADAVVQLRVDVILALVFGVDTLLLAIESMTGLETHKWLSNLIDGALAEDTIAALTNPDALTLKDAAPGSKLVNAYRNIGSDTMPRQSKTGPPIEIHNLTQAGPYTPRDHLVDLKKMPNDILSGKMQRELTVNLFFFEFYVGIDLISRLIGGDENKPRMSSDAYLPFLFNLMGIKSSRGSFLFTNDWATGLAGGGKDIGIIKNNPYANVYRIDSDTANYRNLRERWGSGFPDRKAWEKETESGSYVTDIHNQARNLLSFDIGWLDGDRLFWTKDKDTRQLSTLNTSFKILKDDFRKTALSYPKETGTLPYNRDLYNYFMFGYHAGVQPNSMVAYPGARFGNTVEINGLSGLSYNKGLNSGYYLGRDEANNAMIGALGDMVFTNYVYVLPLFIDNYYPGLKVGFSINGSPFRDMTALEEAPGGYGDLESYGNYLAENKRENAESSLVYDRQGKVLLVSPRFKEGFNTVQFKFTDPGGAEYRKDLPVAQLTVPPFLRAVNPLMNEYINVSSFTAVFEVLDITEGGAKPEDWFNEMAFEIRVDGQGIGDYIRDEDAGTISFDVQGLRDGDHVIEVTADYKGLSAAAGLRFWVDTTPPDISFPSPMIFSNKEAANMGSVSAYISDTVPYGTDGYPADTVYLSRLSLGIVGHTPLFSEENGRMGFFIQSWNGWRDGEALAHGTYQVEVTAEDRVGNRSSGYGEVHIDNRAPYFRGLELTTRTVTLNTGLLGLRYELELDPWETAGYIDIEARNQETKEAFSLEAEGGHYEEQTATLTYFTGGVNVFKDGKYDIKVTSRDILENTGETVTFKDIVVDRTMPEITNAYTQPFILSALTPEVRLYFGINEDADAAENKSGDLDTRISVVDMEGNEVGDIAPKSIRAPSSGAAQVETFHVNPGLREGKYFFKIEAADRNGNIAVGYAAFVKRAVPPEISWPESYGVIDGTVTVYGTVVDPVWDNTLSFESYTVYYRSGEEIILGGEVPDVSGWESGAVQVPEYQRKEGWGMNRGCFTVESSGILATLDTSGMEDGLVTVLVVAEETGGYKIGTSRVFRILHTVAAADTEVRVEIAPPYGAEEQRRDISGGEEIRIPYTVSHSLGNPVDVYGFVRDTKGSIVRQYTFKNLQSNDIRGRPEIKDGDEGIYLYEDDEERFHVILKAPAGKDAFYGFLAVFSEALRDVRDGEGNSIRAPAFVVDENRRIILFENVEGGGAYEFSCLVSGISSITVNALVNNEVAALYAGRGKTECRNATVVLYPGSNYPPISWDGKNEWGGYVENGRYSVGVEAFGRKGGYDSEEAVLRITTPFEFTKIAVDSRVVKTGGGTPEPVGVLFAVNKPSDIEAAVIDEQRGEEIRHIEPLIMNNQVRFSWDGETDDYRVSPPGQYSIKISCTPKDGSPRHTVDKAAWPELAISVEQAKPENPQLKGRLEFLPDEIFDDKPLLHGDARYKTVISPVGQYVPDQRIDVSLEGEGTQIVEAQPDLNYMAAYMDVFTNLKAELSVSGIQIGGSYSYTYWAWWPFKRATDWQYLSFSAVPNNPVLYQGTVMTYDVDANSVKITDIKREDGLPMTISFTGYVDIWRSFDGGDLTFIGIKIEDAIYGLRGGLYLNGTPSVKVSRGGSYMKDPVVSFCTMRETGSTNLGSGRARIYLEFQIGVTCDVDAGNDPRNKYLSYASGFGFAGPDISGGQRSMHKTPYVHSGAPVTVGNMNITDIPVNQSYANVWRTNEKKYLFVAGESYTSRGDPGKGLEAAGNAIQPYADPAEQEPIARVNGMRSLTGVIRQELAGGGEYTLRSGSVDFKLAGSTLTVTTEASDYINYPFPANNRESFNSPHEIDGADIGIPNVRINDVRGGSVPAYFVDAGSVLFAEAQENRVEAAIGIEYRDKQNGYYGQVSIAEIVQKAPRYPPGVNIKRWRIKKAEPAESGLELSGTFLGKTFWMADGGVVEVLDEDIGSIAGSAWDLEKDRNANASALEHEFREINREKLLKYGELPDFRVSSLYPFSGIESELNMYHVGDEERREDNGAVVIEEGIRDYSAGGIESKYNIELVGIDGKTYSGIKAGEPAYFGKGLKLSDGYVINRTDKVSRALVPVYGESEERAALSYRGADGIWRDIPVYKNDAMDKVLTWWDVTGFQGDYLVRLYTETEGEQKVVYEEVTIGYKVEANTESIVQSIDGRAKLILPANVFDRDQVVNIAHVDMEDIKDIAVLPSISPVGKVVKVVPEGLEFSPVRPQLQFLYDKAEIERLNVNPMELVIYFLTPEGRLEALNTVRQVIRVKYDEHDIPQGEEVLWDSAGDPFYDFTADYTYIKVWTELNHFSYYLVLEGMVLGMPEVTEYPEYTAQTAIKIKGTAVPDRELIGYVKEGAIFNGANPGAPGGFAYADARREYQFDAIALPFEGENYIFIGYSGKALSEFRKIKVIRDTRPPELIADISGKAFSPNGDGIKDTLTYDISSDEGGTLRWSLKDADNNTVYEKTRLVEKGEQIQVVLDGSGLEDKVLADGMYVYEMDITDSVGNCSDPVRQFIRLDRELEKPEVTIGEEKLSPRNNDGIYDTLEIAVAIPEDMTVQAFIGTAHTPFYVEILGAVECKEGNTIRLQWGGEDNYGQMVGDGDYYVRIRATDTAGNVRDVNYTEPVAVDNTASEIIGVNFYNGQVLFVPGLIEFKVQVTEETDIGFKISGKEGNKVVDREIKLLPGYNTIKWETNDTLADGEYVLGITGTDRAGNKSEDLNVALKITKDYDEPEIYGLQSDITAEAEGRTTNVDIGDPVILDRSLPVTVTNDSPGEFPLGTTRITWHAVDFYENRAEFIQNITVEDTTAPIIYEMPAEQINVTTANKYLTVDIGSLKAYDLFEVTVRNNSPGRFTHGKTNILWVAEDENGNSSTFSQKVEIVYPDNFSLPDGWFYGEIGDTPREGQSMYGVGQFISTGTGHGIAGMEDQGHYLYREVQGDFSFAAKLHEQSKVDAWTVGGLMIRETMKDDSKVFAALTDATRQIVRAARELERGNADQKVLDAGHSGDLWLLLERKGNQISTYLSADGEYWRQAGEPVSIVMEDSVLVGVLTATGDNRRNGRMVSSQFSFGRLEGADRTNGRGGGFRINRDQGDPKLTVLQGVDVFSPNNDGEKDSGEYKVISTRGGTIKWALRERENEGIAYRGSVNVNGNEETTVTITGMDSEGSVYRDGEYIVEMAVEDTVGNLSNPVFMEVRVDTIVERPEVTVAGEKEITIISGEPMTITGYIGIAGNNTLVKLFEAAEYGKDVKQTIHWDGRDNYGNRLKDDNYIISLEVTDKANNTGYYIYRETPVKVDTTAPIIRGVDFYNGDTMYMVPEPGFYFETNERCRATLTIMNSAGETVYSVTKHDVQGYAAMYWKLEEESREGEYTIRIDAWDDFGNKADPVILQGNLKRNGGE